MQRLGFGFYPKTLRLLLQEGNGPASLEGSAVLLGYHGHVSDQGETNLTTVELNGVGALAVAISDGSGSDDLEVASSSAVSSGHFSVHLSNSSVEGGITVLLVHVVDTRARVITNPYSKVFNLVGLSLVNLLKREDFTSGRLGLAQRSHVVPES